MAGKRSGGWEMAMRGMLAKTAAGLMFALALTAGAALAETHTENVVAEQRTYVFLQVAPSAAQAFIPQGWTQAEIQEEQRTQSQDQITQTRQVSAGYLRARPAADEILILIGDHQPAASVAGVGARWDVPVHVLSLIHI